MNKMNTYELAKNVKIHALRMTHLAKASHIGSCLSIADILAVLYGSILNIDPHNPSFVDRDRFIMSKGHAAAIIYAVLAECGYISISELDSYSADGSRLPGHVTKSLPGIELSTGSLGHGLPVAVGMALAAKRARNNWRTYCLLSDGEMDEGSNWEAIQVAQHFKLDNLVAVIDYNKIQSFGSVKEVSDLHPLDAKFLAFNWNVIEIDGHDHNQIISALQNNQRSDRPLAVVAHTIKGKGVSFMENQLAWHYKSADQAQLSQAISEIEAQYAQ